MTTKPHADPRPLNYALAERWLRADLTKLREQTGLTRIEVCRDTGISIRTLQRIENGPTPVAADNVAVLCQFYGATREHEKELQRLRHYSQKTGWWDEYRGLLNPVYAEHIEAEEQATQTDIFGAIIPGFLQTEAYAARIQSKGFLANTGNEASRYVEVRNRRHERFLKGSASKPRILIDLHSIRHPFSADIMDDQISYLDDLCKKKLLELRVVPLNSLVPPSLHFVQFVFDSHSRPRRQRLLNCYSALAGEIHVEEALQITALQNYFENAWLHAVSLDEASI